MLGSHSACAKVICIKNFKRHFSKAKMRITKDFETFIIFSIADYNTLKVCFYLMLFHITTKVVGSPTAHQCATQPTYSNSAQESDQNGIQHHYH